MSTRKSFLSFTVGNMIGLALSMLSSLWVAKLAGPKSMGFYNVLNLLVVYAPFLTCGVYNGLNREIPYHIGRNEPQRALSLAGVAHHVTRSVSVVSFFLLFIAAGVAAESGAPVEITSGLLAFSAVVPITFYKNFVEVTYRTNGDFHKLSLVRIFVGVVSVATVPLLFISPWDGLMWRTIIVAVVGLVPLWHRRKIVSVPAWDTGGMRTLLTIGLPIFAVGYLYTIMTTLDRSLIARFLDTGNLGLYTPALLFLQGMAVLPMSMNQILYPKMAERYGQTNSLRSLVSLAYKPIPVLLALQAPFVIAGWMVMPWFIHHFLPQYGEGMEAARLALLSGLLLSLTSPAIIFNIAKRQGIYAAIILSASAVMIAVAYVLVGFGVGLTAIVWAAIAADIFFIAACSLAAWIIISRDEMVAVDSVVATP